MPRIKLIQGDHKQEYQALEVNRNGAVITFTRPKNRRGNYEQWYIHLSNYDRVQVETNE